MKGVRPSGIIKDQKVDISQTAAKWPHTMNGMNLLQPTDPINCLIFSSSPNSRLDFCMTNIIMTWGSCIARCMLTWSSVTQTWSHAFVKDSPIHPPLQAVFCIMCVLFPRHWLWSRLDQLRLRLLLFQPGGGRLGVGQNGMWGHGGHAGDDREYRGKRIH